MNICILNISYQHSHSPFKDLDPIRNPSPYLKEHHCELYFIDKSNTHKQITKLIKRGFDLFINLCDGSADEDRAGVEIVKTLEEHGVPFTGANSQFYSITREKTKDTCNKLNIRTPEYFFTTGVDDIPQIIKRLYFPLIVKHPNSYNSIGITKDSVVYDQKQLARQIKIMIRSFGKALVEEYIEGREFTVLVTENPDDKEHPFSYNPVEFTFPKGETFKHFVMKWVRYKEMQVINSNDKQLNQKMTEMSEKLFTGLNGNGYGRCDIRVNEDGDIFMLEINTKCNVFYPREEPGGADYILHNDPNGHKGFLDNMIKCALQISKK